MKVTLAISIDEDLDRRIRALAEERDQPISRLIRRVLEREFWPDRHDVSGAHQTITPPGCAVVKP